MTVVNFAEKYKKNVEIDRDDVLVSIVSHGEQYEEVAAAHQQAAFQAAKYNLQCDVVEGNLDENIRMSYASNVDGAPDAKSKVKLTEAQITAKISTDTQMVKAREDSALADSYLSYASNLLQAMKERGHMLKILSENLV